MWLPSSNHWKTPLLYHSAGWLIFILYEVSFVKLIRWNTVETSMWNSYILPYLINIGLFYLHATVILPRCFDKRRQKVVLFVLLLLVEMGVYLFLMGLKDADFTQPATDLFSLLFPAKIKFIQQLWRCIYFLIFSTAYWLIQRSFKNAQKLKEAETLALIRQQEKKELELHLLSTQNAFLQAQINPHLLFNSLNFIHSEVQQFSTRASDAVIALADMMRYSLFEIKADGKVLLEKEIEQINNLLQINQLRFNYKLCICLQTEGQLDSVRIPPLLLLPFVENLFKYAELTDAGCPAQVMISLKDLVLYFKIVNRKRKTIHFHSPGMGIENVRKRLNTYYPNQYDLHIRENESLYEAELKIKL